jgi:lipopolysaccharide export system protein LptC
VKSRLYDRVAAILSLALLGSLGLFTYYLAVIAERPQEPRPRQATGEPDYFVEGLALIKMNRQGAPAYRLEAESLRHDPASDSTAFTRPRMVSLDPTRPRMVIVADRGRTAREGNETRLDGNVVITRAATPGAEALRAETEHAVILPDQELVRSDRPVRITQGDNLLTGVGMELDNEARRLRLDSSVRVVWQAAQVRATTPTQ